MRGRRPSDGVEKYALYRFVPIYREGFVTGLEIEYLARSSSERYSRAYRAPAVEPAHEYDIVGFGYIKVLAIGFLIRYYVSVREAFRDRVRGTAYVELFRFTAFSRAYTGVGGAGGAHQFAERFGVFAGVEEDSAHTSEYARRHFVGDAFEKLVIPVLRPPYEYVRGVQHFVGKSVYRLFLRCRSHLYVRKLSEKLRKRCMYAARICFRGFSALFVRMIFVKDGYVHIYLLCVCRLYYSRGFFAICGKAHFLYFNLSARRYFN